MLDVVVHTYNPDMSEVEAGRPGAQGHLQLYSKFEPNLAEWDPVFKTKSKPNFFIAFWNNFLQFLNY